MVVIAMYPHKTDNLRIPYILSRNGDKFIWCSSSDDKYGRKTFSNKSDAAKFLCNSEIKEMIISDAKRKGLDIKTLTIFKVHLVEPDKCKIRR